MPKPVSVYANGLWSFKDMSVDPYNSMAIRIRFSTKVTDEHKRDVLDAIHGWMALHKTIADNGGKLPTREELVAQLQQPTKAEPHD